jgi:hypothetical protein
MAQLMPIFDSIRSGENIGNFECTFSHSGSATCSSHSFPRSVKSNSVWRPVQHWVNVCVKHRSSCVFRFQIEVVFIIFIIPTQS